MRVIPYSERMFRGNIYRSMDIAASGLSAQRMRMDAISSNIANMSVTNVDGEGNPYLRRHVQMQPAPEQRFSRILRDISVRMRNTQEGHMPTFTPVSRQESGIPLVEGEEVELENRQTNVVYDPSHPDADADGFVVYPDINIVEEMVDLMVASRAFDANTTVINAAKQMITRSLEI